MKRTTKARPHNPDRLTRRQIGPRPWRLLDEDEIRNRSRWYKQIECWLKGGLIWEAMWVGCVKNHTYRTRLTRSQLAKLP